MPDGTIGEDHQPETHLIPLVLDAATGRRDHIKIFGTDYDTPDGTCLRDYVHVDDLSRAHIAAFEKQRPWRELFTISAQAVPICARDHRCSRSRDWSERHRRWPSETRTLRRL